jgi:hypothetical protein
MSKSAKKRPAASSTTPVPASKSSQQPTADPKGKQADPSSKQSRVIMTVGRSHSTRETGGLVHVSGRVNGGTIDTGRPHCSAAVSESGDTVETKRAAHQFSAIRMRSLNDPHQGSLPTVQTVTSLTRCACKPTIRHHPPGNFDSCSTG